MIPLPAHQDGLVTKLHINALWPIQEMDLEVNQLATITAKVEAQQQTIIDAILQLESAKNVKKEIQDVAQTDLLNAQTAHLNHQLHQIISISSNVTKLIQSNQNAKSAQKVKQKAAKTKEQLVRHAIQSQNFSNAIQRHSPVLLLRTKEISNRPVMLSADTSPHKSSSVPGEVLWPRKVNQRTSTWEKSI